MSADFAILESIQSAKNIPNTPDQPLLAQHWQSWFEQMSDVLLNQSVLLVGKETYRLREIEFYYHGEGHADPFAHRDPMQKTTAQWYFHRDQGSYRGGSFKGLDISFGPSSAFGGVLIRSISRIAGTDESTGADEVNGSCLCVERMLAVTKQPTVAALDGALGPCKVWEGAGILQLARQNDLPVLPKVATARVGLTLKRAYQYKDMPSYIVRPYRFLNDSTWIKKGKHHLVIALYRMGKSAAEIQSITESTKKSIQSLIDAYNAGKELTSMQEYYGKDLGNEDLAKIHGFYDESVGK